MVIPRISRERDPSHVRLKVTLSEGLAYHDAHALLPGLTCSWGTALVACCLLVVPQRRAGVDLPFLAFDAASECAASVPSGPAWGGLADPVSGQPKRPWHRGNYWRRGHLWPVIVAARLRYAELGR